MLKGWLDYRHFVLSAIRGEIRGRFVKSRVGLLWSILHPLAQALIFALILSEVLAARIPSIESKYAFAIYLMAGMCAWSLFSECVTRCLGVFIEYGSAMKKIAFPRICLPLIVWGVALVNHSLLVACVILVFVFLGHPMGLALLVVPIGVLVVSAFGLGLGVVLGVLNVFSRDVGQVFTVLLQIWFWMTPIVYPREIIPEHLSFLVEMNPMSELVSVYQQAMLYNQFPNLQDLGGAIASASILCIVGAVLFRRASAQIVDEL